MVGDVEHILKELLFERKQCKQISKCKRASLLGIRGCQAYVAALHGESGCIFHNLEAVLLFKVVEQAAWNNHHTRVGIDAGSSLGQALYECCRSASIFDSAKNGSGQICCHRNAHLVGSGLSLSDGFSNA